MIASRSAEIVFWTTGIHIAQESERSYQERMTEAEAPLIRRCFMTRQAADEYTDNPETNKPKRLETGRFAKDALKDLLNFELPQRRRWLEISGLKIIPLSSVRG